MFQLVFDKVWKWVVNMGTYIKLKLRNFGQNQLKKQGSTMGSLMMCPNVPIVWFCTTSEHLTLLNDIFLVPAWQGEQNEAILV